MILAILSHPPSRPHTLTGIPNSVRGAVWSHVLEVRNIREDGIYEATKDLGRRTSPDVRQIDLDVMRTFRNHIMFRERYGIKQQALFHVLVAYSMYNPVSEGSIVCMSWWPTPCTTL